MSQTTRQQLADIFGYQSFRGDQEQIIDALLDGKDQMVIMPTGGGKSICYQLPATLLPNLCLVISPLIALMEDQVAALRQLGVDAAALHSGRSYEDRMETESKISDGSLKILYCAPETILQEYLLDYLGNYQIDLIAIDEAHCVSVWGNDFRPVYVELVNLRKHFPTSRWIALTATADGATREEIQTKLQLQEAEVHLSSFERSNLTVTAQPGQNRLREIMYFIKRYQEESGIIYCLSRKSTEDTATKLQDTGYESAAYHAGLDPEERQRIQTAFQNDEIKVICATIAFGMGIDKSNVRYVIHYNLPKNIESYYQEIGRAGRDGLPAETLLFYSWRDVMQLRSFIDDSDAQDHFKEVQRAKLDRMWDLASSKSCRTNIILNYFGEFRDQPCGHCDNCLEPATSFDGTILTQKALSAVARSQQAVTLTTLQDILKGSYKPEIRSRGLDQIKTFGAGRDLTFPEWREYITQMLQQGYLSMDYTDRYHLKLTPLSMDILKGQKEVQLFRFQKNPTKAKTQKPKEEIVVEDALYQRLRSWRSQQAKQQGIPAYTILHDKALRSMSSIKPLSDDQLLSVDGIGKAKLEKYGPQLMQIVKDYLSE